jgi:hypothetical protein
MSERPRPTAPTATEDAAAWSRALLTLDLALEACRAVPPGRSGTSLLPAVLARTPPRGVPRPLWRACVCLGLTDLWQRLGPCRWAR